MSEGAVCRSRLLFDLRWLAGFLSRAERMSLSMYFMVGDCIGSHFGMEALGWLDLVHGGVVYPGKHPLHAQDFRNQHGRSMPCVWCAVAC